MYFEITIPPEAIRYRITVGFEITIPPRAIRYRITDGGEDSCIELRIPSAVTHRPEGRSRVITKTRARSRACARGIRWFARRRICGERNHERFNCEPLASSAQSRRQWAQQVQRLSALLGQAIAGLDCRSLQRGQRGVLERRERAGVSIVTRTGC